MPIMCQTLLEGIFYISKQMISAFISPLSILSSSVMKDLNLKLIKILINEYTYEIFIH